MKITVKQSMMPTTRPLPGLYLYKSKKLLVLFIKPNEGVILESTPTRTGKYETGLIDYTSECWTPFEGEVTLSNKE